MAPKQRRKLWRYSWQSNKKKACGCRKFRPKVLWDIRVCPHSRYSSLARYVISIWVLCKARRPRRKQQKQVLFKHETRSFNKLYLRLKGWEEGEHELDGNSKRSLRYARDMFESSCSNLPPHTHTHTPAHISKNFFSWKQCELTCSQHNFSHWTLTF